MTWTESNLKGVTLADIANMLNERNDKILAYGRIIDKVAAIEKEWAGHVGHHIASGCGACGAYIEHALTLRKILTQE